MFGLDGVAAKDLLSVLLLVFILAGQRRGLHELRNHVHTMNLKLTWLLGKLGHPMPPEAPPEQQSAPSRWSLSRQK